MAARRVGFKEGGFRWVDREERLVTRLQHQEHLSFILCPQRLELLLFASLRGCWGVALTLTKRQRLYPPLGAALVWVMGQHWHSGEDLFPQHAQDQIQSKRSLLTFPEITLTPFSVWTYLRSKVSTWDGVWWPPLMEQMPQQTISIISSVRYVQPGGIMSVHLRKRKASELWCQDEVSVVLEEPIA